MGMDKELYHETIELLRQHIHSDTALDFVIGDSLSQDFAKLLDAYEMKRSRKITILACCMLISLAIHKHRELVVGNDESLTRGILDGDYLLGIFYRIAAVRREWKLIRHLSVYNKRVQLALMNGQPSAALMSELLAEVRSYLERQSA